MAKRPTISKRPAKSEPKAGRPFAPGYGIVGAKDGKGLLPWTWVVRKMNRCRTFWLATILTDLHAGGRRPHVMPVWGVWLDDAFFFSTGRKSRKGQNLSANPACSIANDDGAEAVIVSRAWQLKSRMRRRWSGSQSPTRRNIRWTLGAWKNRSSVSSPAWFSDLWRKVLHSRQLAGNYDP
jgi:hypothetical protein